MKKEKRKKCEHHNRKKDHRGEKRIQDRGGRYLSSKIPADFS
jgi:hypothetical protein